MSVVRGHLFSLAVVAGALVAAGVVFGFYRPAHRAETIPLPRDHGLPYTQVSFKAADARRAFAAVGITLGPRSRMTGVTTLGNRNDILEVDAFGDRARVERSGFYDYTTAGLGAAAHYVHFARDCSHEGAAERWHGNVRVMVDCARAGSAAPRWLRLVNRALARL